MKQKISAGNQFYASLSGSKQVQQQKSKRKRVALWVCCGVAAVALAVFVTALALDGSAFFERKTAAVTVGSYDVSPAIFNYYYKEQKQTVESAMSSLGSYSSSARSGIDEDAVYDEENGKTWRDALIESAEALIQDEYAVYNEAIANGYALTAADEQAVADAVDAARTEAGSGGLDQYLAETYGKGCREDNFRQFQEIRQIAQSYAQQYQDQLTYTEQELTEAYEANRDNYDCATYRSFFLDGKATDELTNEEHLAQAKEKAEAFVAAATDEASYIAQTQKYAPEGQKSTYADPDATLSEDAQLSLITTTKREWLQDSSRKHGDIGYVPFESYGYYVMYFDSLSDNDYPSVNVRRILVKDEETAQQVEDAWRQDGATEDAFAALADQYTTDTEAAAGGLIANGGHTDFDKQARAWCFDAGRQPGDVTTLACDDGYELLYFAGTGESYRDALVTEALRKSDGEAWKAALKEQYPVQAHSSGLKHTAAYAG